MSLSRILPELLMVLLLASCTPLPTEQASRPYQAARNFNLFLQALPQEANRLSFAISAAEVVTGTGERIPLHLLRSNFNGSNSINTQLRLVSDNLPTGSYKGVILHIDTAQLRGEQGTIALLAPKLPLQLDHYFLIQDNRSETLCISLSGEGLVTDGVFFTPQMVLWKAQRLLPSLKGFVSNAMTKDLTIFNKRTLEVVSHIQVGNGPRDLALNERRGLLYVAMAGEDAVAVVDVNREDLVGWIKLRYGDEPTELALNPAGDLLLVLNLGSNSVSIIDAASLFETSRIRLQLQPTNFFFGSDERAYITHAETNSLTLLDARKSIILATRELSDAPLDGIAGIDNKFIYLINNFSANLTILKTNSMNNERQVFIGPGALCLVEDRLSGQLFIGRNDGEIAVVDPRSLTAIDSYAPANEAISRMTLDRDQNALFVLLPSSDRLLKIDSVSKKIMGWLQLDGNSQSVAVMGQR